MDNYRLGAEIWKLINDTFNLSYIKEEVYEKFPRDFVDFVVNAPETEGWFDYNLFEGEEEGNIDEFISRYLSLRRMNDYKDYEGIDKVLEELEKTNLWHPYLDIEKIRYHISLKELELASKIGQRLWEKEYDDLYLKYYLALFSMELGEFEKAYIEAKDLLNKFSGHYGARKIIYRYYFEKGSIKRQKISYLIYLKNGAMTKV